MLDPEAKKIAADVADKIFAIMRGTAGTVVRVSETLAGRLSRAFVEETEAVKDSSAKAATLSPKQFASSPLFLKQYPYMGFRQVLLLLAIFWCYHALMGYRPSLSESTTEPAAATEGKPPKEGGQPPTKIDASPKEIDRSFQYAGYAILVLLSGAVYFRVRGALATLGVNRLVAQQAAKDINALLSAYRQGESRRSIEDIEALIPKNFSNAGMTRLLRQVVSEAKNWRFDSMRNLVEPYQTEITSVTAQIDDLQRLALRLGVLGSFIGLMLSISQLPSLMGRDPSPGMLTAFLPNFLGPLYLKFGCSIAGLIVSIYAHMMDAAVGREQRTLFREMEDTTAGLLEVASRSINTQGFLNQFDQLRARLKELDEQFVVQNQKLEDLATPLTRLGTFHESAEKYLQSITAAQDHFFLGMNQLLNTLQLQSVAERFEQGMKTLMEKNHVGYSALLEKGQENHIRETQRKQEQIAFEVEKLRAALHGVAGPLTRGVAIISLILVGTVLILVHYSGVLK